MCSCFAVYAFLVVVILVIAIPVIYIVSASFSSASAVLGGKVWLWPVNFTLTGYKAVFDYPEIWTAYLNSIIYAVASAALIVPVDGDDGLPPFPSGFLRSAVLHLDPALRLHVQRRVIPFYLVVQELGMVNTRFSLIISHRAQRVLGHSGEDILPVEHPVRALRRGPSGRLW